MIRKATLVLIAAIGIASPALAQSWDPDMGTGNLVAIHNGAAAVHHSAAQNGRNGIHGIVALAFRIGLHHRPISVKLAA